MAWFGLWKGQLFLDRRWKKDGDGKSKVSIQTCLLKCSVHSRHQEETLIKHSETCFKYLIIGSYITPAVHHLEKPSHNYISINTSSYTRIDVKVVVFPTTVFKCGGISSHRRRTDEEAQITGETLSVRSGVK